MNEDSGNDDSFIGGEKEAAVGEEFVGNDETSTSIWNQMVEIVKFSGPATGLWICGPLMSLIDTVVIGQSSSMELAALGISLLSAHLYHNMIILSCVCVSVCVFY